MPIDHCGVNLNGQGFQVEFYDLLKICHADSLTIVPLKDIEIGPYCSLQRYHLADIRFPCILLEKEKPDDKYQVLDGNHRLNNLLDAGTQTSIFYIVKRAELECLKMRPDEYYLDRLKRMGVKVKFPSPRDS